MSSVGLLSQLQLDVLQLDPVLTFPRPFLCSEAGRHPTHHLRRGESLSAPSVLGISPPGRTHASSWRSWSGRAEGGVGRAVNHLCFLMISRAARDQSAAS